MNHDVILHSQSGWLYVDITEDKQHLFRKPPAPSEPTHTFVPLWCNHLVKGEGVFQRCQKPLQKNTCHISNIESYSSL